MFDSYGTLFINSAKLIPKKIETACRHAQLKKSRNSKFNFKNY